MTDAVRQPVPASLLREIAAGRPVTRLQAAALMSCSDDDLPELLAAARAIRDRFKPGVITYSRKVFIPLTRLCRDYCGYCTFRRDPQNGDLHTMTPEEVMAVVRQGERAGCTEALFSLGDKPEMIFPEMRKLLEGMGYSSTLQYLEAVCEMVVRESTLLPHANPGLLDLEWLRRLVRHSPSLGLMLETTSRRLLAPGAAHHGAPDKNPQSRLQTITDAGRIGIPFTSGILIGIGETIEERVDSLMTLHDLHTRYGHIQEVIVQNFRAKPGIPMQAWPEPSRGDMLRTVAVARLIVGNMNLQAPPNLSSPDYEPLLEAGINDWGGISPITQDYINPEAPWPQIQQLEQRTRAAGFELRQRLPVYPEFIKPGRDLWSWDLRARVDAAADPQGLARSVAA